MPGRVKIGLTTKESVDDRMKELFNTSVPVPFECEYACKVDDCVALEKALHIAFHPNRINPGREFFSINLEQAITILKLFDKGDITKEIKAEINNDLTDIDKEAGKKLKQNRRPPLNFTEMNIPIGSKLVYVKDEGNIEETVCSDRKISYNGKETSLTALTQKLLGLKYRVSPGIYWLYNGKTIHDIYDETYTIEE